MLKCRHCGCTERHSRHIKYGNDEDNPTKHWFEPEIPKRVNCDLRGEWINLQEALTWPEGSIVLIRELNIPLNQACALKLDEYFRPDWIKKYYSGIDFPARPVFMLLKLP